MAYLIWLLAHEMLEFKALFSQFCWREKSSFFPLSGLFETLVRVDTLPKPFLVHLHTVKGHSEIFSAFHFEAQTTKHEGM